MTDRELAISLGYRWGRFYRGWRGAGAKEPNSPINASPENCNVESQMLDTAIAIISS